MAVYYKPQSPIQSGEDFIYPITTADQIMKSDNSRRLEQAGLIVADNSTNLGGITAESYALKSDTVPTSRTINGKALSSNIVLNADDVRALATGGTAANSSKLNGQEAGYYATASALTALTDRVAALESIPNAEEVSY